MPERKRVSAFDDPSFIGMGGVTGANQSLWPRNAPCHVMAMAMYAGTKPQGEAPGHNPAYGSVGNDGHWPGERR